MVAFQPPVYGRKARMTAVFSGGTIVANQGLLKAFYKHHSSGLDFVKVLINILVGFTMSQSIFVFLCV